MCAAQSVVADELCEAAFGCEATVKPESGFYLSDRSIRFYDCNVAVAHQTGRSLVLLVSCYRFCAGFGDAFLRVKPIFQLDGNAGYVLGIAVKTTEYKPNRCITYPARSSNESTTARAISTECTIDQIRPRSTPLPNSVMSSLVCSAQSKSNETWASASCALIPARKVNMGCKVESTGPKARSVVAGRVETIVGAGALNALSTRVWVVLRV